ncbi:MAG TPA: hypothetical protein VD861_15760 [Pyrinomonadaceae bacterium]|nr:hypothetical protein [Pyrinomonadaceae bacterium]
MPPPYLTLDQLLLRVDEPYRSACRRLLGDHGELFRAARGSSHNHQAWAGGYADHVREAMNIAAVLYDALSPLRPVPFSLSDALVVMFVHDLEKPWAYEPGPEGWRRREGLKENAHAFRLAKLAEAGVTLPAELELAVRFVEGEGSHYSGRARVMSPLAAFCHMCDVASARLWHDYPLERGDPWEGAGRSNAEPAAAADGGRDVI